MKDNEIWKDIENFPDYQVSNLGRVKSFKRNKIRILNPGISNNYLRTLLTLNHEKFSKFIHILVGEAFIGICPEGSDWHHIDTNTLNNRVENLKILTKLEHYRLTFRIFNHEKRSEIRELYKEGILTYKVLAEQFGTCPQTICNIVNEVLC